MVMRYLSRCWPSELFHLWQDNPRAIGLRGRFLNQISIWTPNVFLTFAMRCAIIASECAIIPNAGPPEGRGVVKACGLTSLG